MTLGGLLKHLAFVEDDWFGHDLPGLDRDAPWVGVDLPADPDWDRHSAADDHPDTLRGRRRRGRRVNGTGARPPARTGCSGGMASITRSS